MKAERVWDDWGLPALMVLVTFDLQPLFAALVDSHSFKRVVLSAGLAVAVFVAITSNIGGRWTSNLTREYVNAGNVELKGWLPEERGVLYSAAMYFFYETFFKNPKADWRYALGFEPSLMPRDDFATYHNIMWNFGDARAYEPWVKKMRLKDRLVIRGPGSARPAIPELEWKYAVSGTWIGRLPR